MQPHKKDIGSVTILFTLLNWLILPFMFPGNCNIVIKWSRDFRSSYLILSELWMINVLHQLWWNSWINILLHLTSSTTSLNIFTVPSFLVNTSILFVHSLVLSMCVKICRYFLNPESVSIHLFCSICQEVFNNPQRAPCGHSFCKQVYFMHLLVLLSYSLISLI